MASGIYKIENLANGRCYIGSAVHLVNRWASHRRGLRKGEHRNRYLQRAWDKYGEDAFSFTVIEAVADVAQLVAREQVHIDAHVGKLYNLAPTAGSNLGTKRTAASKEKSRASNLGQKRTEEARSAMSEAQKRSNAENRQFLAMRSEQLRSARQNVDRDKQRAASAVASKSRVWSEQSRAKLSAAKMGVRLSPEAIAKMAATKCKPVICTTTGVEFPSASAAAAACGVSITAVSRICLGRYKQAFGLQFIYKEQ